MGIKNKLVDFLGQDKKRNIWITDGVMSVYVRRSVRNFEGNNLTCLDIANVIIHDEKKRGTGIFKSFILFCEMLEMPIYIESILNKRFYLQLVNNGYLVATLPHCLYKLPNTNV